QVQQFKVVENGISSWMTGTNLYIMGGLTLLTILVVLGFSRLTKAIPASLVAIILTSALVFFFHIDTKKVLDIASVSGSLPTFHIPMVPVNWETLEIVFPYALIMAGVGLVESLLTLSMVDEITNTKGNSNREAMAQGQANMVNGFFGGMGGCAMVAQTLVNLDAGARTRTAEAVRTSGTLTLILVGGHVTQQITTAAWVGVMMMV